MSSLTPHQSKALDINSHISLTANAGSGKTFVLTQRYLKIAIEGNVPLRDIAAITFTEKAASELYKKIAERIETELNEESDYQKKLKLESLRRQLISANISTIHSFCINILREFPVEAGIDANFSPIDETLSTELIELSVDEIIKKDISTGATNSSTKTLTRLFDSLFNLRHELISLIRNRKNIITLSDSLYNKSIEEIASEFSLMHFNYFELIISPQLENKLRMFKKINDAAIAQGSSIARELSSLLEQDIENNSIMAFSNNIAAYLKAFTGKFTLRKIGYLAHNWELFSNEIKEVEEFFKTAKLFMRDENSVKLELELAFYGKTIIELFESAYSVYENKKRQMAYLDFEDILLKTMDIIKKEEVKQKLSSKYRYIMIDEYQDTNEIQYNIFLPILNELKTGNLFVVGDEKQSIYRFRDAELEVFERTKENIKSIEGSEKNLSLPDSFRMSPVICVFTNRLFEILFANALSLFNEVAPNPIICAKQDELDGSVELLFKPKINTEKPHSLDSVSEAELVARRIINLANHNPSNVKVELKDIAVLCRKRKSFKELESVFNRYKIPYSIVGGTGFYQQQIIYDVNNYCSFLLNPQDDTALISILRSPFFYFSDTAIFEISLIKGVSFWDKFQIYSSKVNTSGSPVAALRENILIAQNSDIVFLLRKIMSESAYLPVISAKDTGNQELANFEKLIQLTNSFYKQGFRNLYDYTIFLRQAIQSYSDEGQAALVDDANSVKIMTIHQSKGLEFKAVVLFGMHEYTETASVKAKKIFVDKKIGIITKTPFQGNYLDDYQSAPIVDVYSFINKKKNTAEIKRLLYVGITRAKNYLFLSADLDKRSSSDSFLSLIKELIEIEPEINKYDFLTDLSYLKKVDDQYSIVTEPIRISIAMNNLIDENTLITDDNLQKQNEFQYRLDEQVHFTNEEVISATKIALFNRCPIKYQLTYEFGFGIFQRKLNEQKFDNPEIKLSRRVNQKLNDESEFSDEISFDLSKYADIKGRIIHKILEEQTEENLLKHKIQLLLNEEAPELDKAGELAAVILTEMKSFYSSSVYLEIKDAKSFFNEYELYAKIRDFYLYGIIDKVIINENDLVVVDYKTDAFSIDKTEEKVQNYLPQLKFYGLLLSKKHPSIGNINLKLVFVSHPESSFTYKFNSDEINHFENEIIKTVNLIREEQFVPNLNHCPHCIFSVNKSSCILTTQF